VTSPVAAPRETAPDPHGLRLGQVLSMGVLRFAVLTAATSIASALATQSGEDPVGAGLSEFLLTAAAAGLWSALDAWRRHPLTPLAIAWALASVLLVVLGPLPETLARPPAEGGWTGLGAYLAQVGDGAVFMFALTAVPAAAGLFIGHLIRRSGSPPTD
jgi:hypothetical protein